MMNPILSVFKIHFNTVHMCTHSSSMRSVAFRLSTEFLYAFLLTSMCTVYLVCLILCDLVILIISGEEWKLWISSLCICSFQAHIFSSLPILKHLRARVSHPYVEYLQLEWALVDTVMNLWLQQMEGISWLAEELSASQRMYSVELLQVSWLETHRFVYKCNIYI